MFCHYTDNDSYEHYEPSEYYGYGYEYDHYCDCDEICGHGQHHPEEWEFQYEEVPPCTIHNCGTQLDQCASNDQCVEGIGGIVSTFYHDNENPMECMDGLVQDTESNAFNDLCDGNEECGADLKALGECVVNQANYGFCPQEIYKKLKLKSLAKTVKKRSRKRKRKAVAAKQKLKRKSKTKRKGKRGKRGKRTSKLRKSRRKLQESHQSDSYEHQHDDSDSAEYDYGCYCDCGEEEDEIPQCVIDNCGEQLFACGSSDDCIAGVEGVISTCYENNDNPQQCMDELIKESSSTQVIELCDGNEEAAGDLQALGDCVVNSTNYGYCSEDEYKKLKMKALLKATKKIRARKVASSQKRGLHQKRARSPRAYRQRQMRMRPDKEQHKDKYKHNDKSIKGTAQRQRSMRLRKGRVSRRKLQSAGCCECTQSQSGPNCNDECDANICSYEPYCCKYQWDWICADAAVEECDGSVSDDSYDYDSWYEPTSGDYDYYQTTGSSGCWQYRFSINTKL